MFFLLFLLGDRRIADPDPYLRLMDLDPGGLKSYMDPRDPDSDPDSQHWL